MLNTLTVNIRRVGISRSKIAVIAVVAFMTLTFFAIGYTAVEEAESSAAAAIQQGIDPEGESAAISVFKFV